MNKKLFINFKDSSINVPVDDENYEIVIESYFSGKKYCTIETANNQILILNIGSAVSLGNDQSYLTNQKAWTTLSNFWEWNEEVYRVSHWFSDLMAGYGDEDKCVEELKCVFGKHYVGDLDGLFNELYALVQDGILDEFWFKDEFPGLGSCKNLIYLSDHLKIKYKNGYFYTDSLGGRSNYGLFEHLLTEELESETIFSFEDYDSGISYTKLKNIEYIGIPKVRYMRSRDNEFKKMEF